MVPVSAETTTTGPLRTRERVTDAAMEALATATRTPARALGFADLGTLEPGKLADLVILDADPTENIRNTEKISKVMMNGRLYDAATLNEEVTGNRQRQPYYWEK